jgi:transketolase
VADVLRDGTNVTIVGIGGTVWAALEAAELLAEEGIEARVINAASLVPFDQSTIIAAAAETGAIVTVEEGNVSGGLGAAVATIVADSDHRVRVHVLGLREFAPTGSTEYLLEYFGLTPEGIATSVREVVGRATSRN